MSNVSHPASLIDVPFRRFKPYIPAWIWIAARRSATYVSRLLTWRRVLGQVRGVAHRDQQVLKQSARLALTTALDKLDDWQDPLPIEEADVVVRGVGQFHVRAYCDDLYHILPAREPAVLQLIRSCLMAGDLFVDAGANIGFYTVAASGRVGPEGRVIAVEMMPDTASILRDHLNRNDCFNVDVIERALSDQAGLTIEATVEAGKFGQASIVRQSESADIVVKSVAVQSTTLDLLLESEPRPVALIKLDLEGAELAALLGATKTLERTNAVIFEQLGEAREVRNLLMKAGFSVRALDSNNWLAER